MNSFINLAWKKCIFPTFFMTELLNVFMYMIFFVMSLLYSMLICVISKFYKLVATLSGLDISIEEDSCRDYVIKKR